MLSFEPNVVVIDDKIEEVKGVLNWYQDKGIGCKYLNSDLFEGDNMQEEPFSDVNLVFLDLFYSEGTFDAELCANWVQSIVSEKSFYVLIIWSKDPVRAKDILSELGKLSRLPFCCLVKNKTDFLVDTKEKYNYTELFGQISSEINAVPALAEIGIWKKRLSSSSNKVIGNLFKIPDPSIFQLKLQKIIIGHGGSSIIQEKDVLRKRDVLFDALDRVLVSNTKDSIPHDAISEINIKNLYALNLPDDKVVDKELNSWFHFNLMKEINSSLVLPGLVSENNHSLFKKLYSIQDDDKVAPKLSTLIEHGNKISDIVVVITRPCDIAQGKLGKNIKLVSGMLIEKPSRTKKGKINFTGGSVPDSCKIYDHLYINEDINDAAFIFDFRYVFSVPHKVFVNKFKNLKIFNKELLSELQVEYSSYSSRLGITQVI